MNKIDHSQNWCTSISISQYAVFIHLRFVSASNDYRGYDRTIVLDLSWSLLTAICNYERIKINGDVKFTPVSQEASRVIYMITRDLRVIEFINSRARQSKYLLDTSNSLAKKYLTRFDCGKVLL